MLYFTYFTAILALTSMYACMLYQNTLVTECLITHITNIMALTNMYTLMCYQIPLSRVPYYTNHRHKGTHHYIWVYVLSDSSVD